MHLGSNFGVLAGKVNSNVSQMDPYQFFHWILCFYCTQFRLWKVVRSQNFYNLLFFEYAETFRNVHDFHEMHSSQNVFKFISNIVWFLLLLVKFLFKLISRMMFHGYIIVLCCFLWNKVPLYGSLIWFDVDSKRILSHTLLASCSNEKKKKNAIRSQTELQSDEEK